VRHISKAFKSRYRYNATNKYKEYQHERTCLRKQKETIKDLQIQTLREELKSSGIVTLKKFEDAIQRIYDTYPVEKQDTAIEKILNARLLLEKNYE